MNTTNSDLESGTTRPTATSYNQYSHADQGDFSREDTGTEEKTCIDDRPTYADSIVKVQEASSENAAGETAVSSTDQDDDNGKDQAKVSCRLSSFGVLIADR